MKTTKTKSVDRHLIHLAHAVRLSRPPGIFTNFLAAVKSAGLVGEETNALMLFLAATSRMLSRPVNLFIKGPSSSGKNFLASRVLKFLPDNEVVTISSSSEAAWNYLGGDLEHKVVYIHEENKATGNVHPARVMISEKEIVRMVSVRDGKDFRTERRVTKGPIACISTTTKGRLQVDDENRFLSIFMDDSREQTQRILDAAGDEAPEMDDHDFSAWHGLQNALVKRARLPFASGPWRKYVTGNVWNEDVRIRRYFPAFEGLTKTVCLLRSFRFTDQQLEKNGQHTLTFSDFAVANLISREAFSRSLSSPTEDDLGLQQALLRISGRLEGVGVSAADLARELNISEHQAYRQLKNAHQQGAIRRVNKSERGNKKLYLPSPSIQMLPEPNSIFQQLDLKKASFWHPVTGQLITLRK